MQDSGLLGITAHLNLLDTMPVMILDVDRYGILLFANKKARDRLGIPEDAEEVSLEDILDKGSLPAATSVLEQLFSGDGDVTTTWRLNTPGIETYVNANAITICENDYPVRVRLYMHSLSESAHEEDIPPLDSSQEPPQTPVSHNAQKKAELDAAMREDREYLNALLQKSGVLVYVFDSHNRLVEVNRRMIEVTGFDLENAPTLAALMAGLYPGAKERVIAHSIHNDMYRAKHIKESELKIRTRSGEEKFVSWSSGTLRVGTGDIGSFIVIGIDVTEKKRIERWLRMQGNLVALVSDGIVVTDLKNTIVKWLGGAEKMMGYSARQVIGRPFHSLLPETKRQEIYASITQGVKKDGKWIGSVVLQSGDKRTLAVRMQATLLRSEEGTLMGMVVVLNDITREKQLETAYRQATQNRPPGNG